MFVDMKDMFEIQDWNIDLYRDFVERMKLLAEADYKAFNGKLIPGEDYIIGIRIPDLRKIAKKILSGNWRSYLEVCDSKYHEERLLQAIIIGNIKSDYNEIERYILKFLPSINNWSVCDTFCSGLKIAKIEKKRMYPLIQDCLSSDNMWEIRFAVVMLLEYYIDEDYLADIFKYCNLIKSDEYYVKMAVAWLISMCYVKYDEETLKYLNDNDLDDFTYNKSIQKIVESYRVNNDKKEILKSMKRKKKK